MPSDRYTHEQVMATVPDEWTVLEECDYGHSSWVRFAVRHGDAVGIGSADCWREDDTGLIDLGEWMVDPESGASLTRDQATKILEILDAE